MGLLEPGIHFGIPDAEYRADPGYNQSTLKKFGLANTPAHYRQELLDEAQKKEDDDESKQEAVHFRIGRLVDATVLSGDISTFVRAPKTYPCEPTKKDPRTERPWIMSSDWCKSWVAANKELGRTVMTGDEVDRAAGCVVAINRHEDCRDSINISHHQVTVIATHPKGWRLKGRFDMWPKRTDIGWAWDLKTCRDASEPGFNDAAGSLGYHIQAGFYMMLAELVGVHLHSFGFFAVESEKPHGVQSFYVQRGSKEHTRAIELIERWLPAYHECVTTDKWPCYPTEWVKVELSEYHLKDRRKGERLA